MKSSLLLLIGLYKAVAAVHLGGACRFEPSCSCYAVDAAKMHKPLIAVRLIVVRLLKCRPGGPWGYDPVPHFHHSTDISANHRIANSAAIRGNS